jgi:hypothetical protein
MTALTAGSSLSDRNIFPQATNMAGGMVTESKRTVATPVLATLTLIKPGTLGCCNQQKDI